MYLCILKFSSIAIHGFHKEKSSVVGFKENSSITRTFVPNPSPNSELIGEISLVESPTSGADGLEKNFPPQDSDPVTSMNNSLGI